MENERNVIIRQLDEGIFLDEKEDSFKRLQEFCGKTQLDLNSQTLEVNNGSFVILSIISRSNVIILILSRFFGFLSAEEALQAMAYMALGQLGIEVQTEEQEEQELVEDAQDVLLRGVGQMGKVLGLGFDPSNFNLSDCSDVIGKLAECLIEGDDE